MLIIMGWEVKVAVSLVPEMNIKISLNSNLGPPTLPKYSFITAPFEFTVALDCAIFEPNVTAKELKGVYA